MATRAVLLWPSTAHADGIDIAWFLTRVGGWRQSPFRAVLLIGAIAAANYLLNMLVVVLPAVLSGAPVKRAALDVIGFTFIAQVADRAGMVAYSLTVYTLDVFMHVVSKDLGEAVIFVLAANFFTSGILLWFLARHYCLKRWNLPRRRSVAISWAAAILTNPSWAIATAAIPGFSGQGR
jgi:hypothetical protein